MKKILCISALTVILGVNAVAYDYSMWRGNLN